MSYAPYPYSPDFDPKNPPCEDEHHFTNDQVIRMHWHLENTYLQNLWSDDNLEETNVNPVEVDASIFALNPMQYCFNAGSGPCTQFFPSIAYDGSLFDYAYQWDVLSGSGEVLYTQTNPWPQFFCNGPDGIGPNGICCAPSYQLTILYDNCPIAEAFTSIGQTGDCCSNQATVSFPQGLVVDANNILPVPGMPQLRQILEGVDNKAFNGDLVLNNVFLDCSQNGKFLFAEDSKLLINEGSLLKTNGNIFDACNLHWEGINIVSTALGHGGLILNGGQMNHSVRGVFSEDGDPDYDLQFANDGNLVVPVSVPADNGAGVKAGDLFIQNTSFTDNLRALEIRDAVKGSNFGPVNQSIYPDLSIQNATFTVSDDLYNRFDYVTPACAQIDCPPGVPTDGQFNFKSHVYLYQSKGAEFLGCTFKMK